MSRSLLVPAAAALFVASGALAGAHASAFNGFFVGVQLGDTFGEASQAQSSAIAGPFTSSPTDFKIGALGVGANLGFDWTFDQFSVGVIGDYTALSGDDDDGASGGDTNNFEVDDLLTARVRAGWFALPRTLLYVHGGGAWLAGSASVDGGATSTTESEDAEFAGYTYGLGANFAVGEDATIGIEWRRYEFDQERTSFNGALNGYDLGIDPEFDTVQISLNYYLSGLTEAVE